MTVAVRAKEKERVNPLDGMMTPAQVARRKFKSTLPRKIENRVLTALQAIGETFTLLGQFQDTVIAEKRSKAAAKTVYAALAYSLPDSAKLAYTITVPDPGKAVGIFCDAVVGIERKSPAFLGVVFIQVDPDAETTAYKAVSFVVPFMTGPDVEARLLFAQRETLAEILRIVERQRN